VLSGRKRVKNDLFFSVKHGSSVRSSPQRHPKEGRSARQPDESVTTPIASVITPITVEFQNSALAFPRLAGPATRPLVCSQ
jgi:hypothetical protein